MPHNLDWLVGGLFLFGGVGLILWRLASWNPMQGTNERMKRIVPPKGSTSTSWEVKEKQQAE